MNRLAVVLSTFLTFALVFALPAEAQRGQHPGEQVGPGMMALSDSIPGPMMGRMQAGMMQMMQGMHQQMMQNPMHRSTMMVFMLPAMADTLGLSDQQRTRLQELKSEAMSQRKEHRKQMMNDRKEFMALFEEGQPSPDQVRQHLMSMAEMRAGHRATLYETAHSMKQVLTDEQRQTLDGMTLRQRMHQMTETMPMMGMMQMLRFMNGGKMGGGMMPYGGMTQRGEMKTMPMQKNRQNQ